MLIWLLISCAAIQLSACGKKSPPLPPGVLARVNGQSILFDDFEVRYAEASTGAVEPLPADAAGALAVRLAFLDQLIMRALIEQEAGRLGLAVTDAEVNNILQGMNAGYNAEAYSRIMREKHRDPAALRDDLRHALLADKLAARAVLPSITVRDEELKAYYQSHLAEFTAPEQVHARQIVCAMENEALTALTEVLTGKPFEQVAQAYSIAAEASRGGDLGFFARGELQPEVEAAAFMLGVGEVSTLIKSDFGYHIIQVLDRRPATILTFDQARSTIFRELRQARAEQAWPAYLAGLKAKAVIEINRALLPGG